MSVTNYVVFSRLPKNVIFGSGKWSRYRKRKTKIPYEKRSYSDILTKIWMKSETLNFDEIQEQTEKNDINTAKYIFTALTNFFGITEPNRLIGPYRKTTYPHIRFCAFYLTKHHTMMSLKAIGRFYGGRDHSTVIHGLKKIDDILWKVENSTADDNDKQIYQAIQFIQNKLSQ